VNAPEPSTAVRLSGMLLNTIGVEWCMMEVRHRWIFQSNIYISTAVALSAAEKRCIRDTFDIFRHPQFVVRVHFARVKQ
jgi:hypothetical protein